MGLVELLLLAVGLSMDAFAVSVCKGLAMGEVKPKHALICGAWFGGFQALMPMIGYLLGEAFENIISAVSSWIAFGLLVLIGGNMLREALSKDEEKASAGIDVKTMFLMAVATSIDALAVGITFACVPVQLFAGPQLLIYYMRCAHHRCDNVPDILRRSKGGRRYTYTYRREDTAGTSFSEIKPSGAANCSPAFYFIPENLYIRPSTRCRTAEAPCPDT